MDIYEYQIIKAKPDTQQSPGRRPRNAQAPLYMPKYEDVIESKYLKWRLEVCRHVSVGLCNRLCELCDLLWV